MSSRSSRDGLCRKLIHCSLLNSWFLLLGTITAEKCTTAHISVHGRLFGYVAASASHAAPADLLFVHSGRFPSMLRTGSCLLHRVLTHSAVQWFFWGYSLTFSPTGSKFIGDLRNFGLMSTLDQVSAGSAKIPALVYCVYQMMFATITVRMHCSAWLSAHWAHVSPISL